EIPREQLRALARKMLTGTITPEEQAILDQWLNAHPGSELTWHQGDKSEEELGERVFSRITADAGLGKRRKIYWAAAASIIVLLAAGIYFWSPPSTPVIKEVAQVVPEPEAIMPGSDKAILTLGNGRQIKLEGQKVITDGDLQIKNENNELI